MRDSTYDVFISYRRAGGGAELAQLVRAALVKRGFRVFMDVRELAAGPFDMALKTTIEQAENFVVLLTPGCLDRFAGEGDWFRQEVTLALVAKKNVVPLKTEDFQFPPIQGLPKAAAILTRQHAVTYVHEHSDASLDKLCGMLRPRRRRHPRRWLCGAGAALALLVGGAAWWGTRPRNIPAGDDPVPDESPPGPIDLLALVDPNRGGQKGQWMGGVSGLVGKGGDKLFYLALPWQPPAEYRLRINVTRLGTIDKHPLQIGLTSGDHRFALIVDSGYRDRLHTGIGMIDGRSLADRRDPRPGRILSRGTAMELVATVERDGVQLHANNKLIYEWHGDLSRTSRHPAQPTQPLTLGGGGGSFLFDKIVLEPLGGDAGHAVEMP